MVKNLYIKKIPKTTCLLLTALLLLQAPNPTSQISFKIVKISPYYDLPSDRSRFSTCRKSSESINCGGVNPYITYIASQEGERFSLNYPFDDAPITPLSKGLSALGEVTCYRYFKYDSDGSGALKTLEMANYKASDIKTYVKLKFVDDGFEHLIETAGEDTGDIYKYQYSESQDSVIFFPAKGSKIQFIDLKNAVSGIAPTLNEIATGLTPKILDLQLHSDKAFFTAPDTNYKKEFYSFPISARIIQPGSSISTHSSPSCHPLQLLKITEAPKIFLECDSNYPGAPTGAKKFLYYDASGDTEISSGTSYSSKLTFKGMKLIEELSLVVLVGLDFVTLADLRGDPTEFPVFDISKGLREPSLTSSAFFSVVPYKVDITNNLIDIFVGVYITPTGSETTKAYYLRIEPNCIEGCSSCAVSPTEGPCTACEDGFATEDIGGGNVVCKKCDVSCATCTVKFDSAKCVTCSDTSKKIDGATEGSCTVDKVCHSSCGSCSEMENEMKCQTCSDSGFEIENGANEGKCVKKNGGDSGRDSGGDTEASIPKIQCGNLNLPYCEKCHQEDLSKGCERCTRGHGKEVKDGVVYCIQCPKNCEVCEMTPHGRQCQKCFFGFRFHEIKQTCFGDSLKIAFLVWFFFGFRLD